MKWIYCAWILPSLFPKRILLSSEIHWWGACLHLWTGLWQLFSEGQRFRSVMVWVNKYWCQGQELLRGRDQATALDHQRQWMWCALERDELAWWWPDPQGSRLWFFSFKNLRTEVIGSLLRSSRTWLESSWQRVVASYLSIPRPDSTYRPRIHGINPSSLKQESFPWHKVSWGNLLGNPALEKGLLDIGSELRLIPGNSKHCCGLPTRGFWG